MALPTSIKNFHLLFIIGIILVVLSEMLLVNQIFHLKKQLSEYSHLDPLLSQARQRLNHMNYLKDFEGQTIPTAISQALNHHRKHHLGTKNFAYAILFYFLPTDCSSCLYGDIADWNNFYQFCQQKNCQIFGLTDTTKHSNPTSIARSLNIRFPLVQVAGVKNLLSTQGITLTPISFFVDLTLNKIIYANANLPYSQSDNEAFIKKLHKMLDETN